MRADDSDEDTEQDRELRAFQLDWLSRHPVPRKDLASEGGASGNPRKVRTGKGKGVRSKDPFAPPVEAEIDLHDRAVDEALAETELFLESWRRSPGTRLRIIHGRGADSGGAVRAAVLRNLRSKWKARVRFVQPESGNPGATLVEIA